MLPTLIKLGHTGPLAQGLAPILAQLLTCQPSLCAVACELDATIIMILCAVTEPSSTESVVRIYLSPAPRCHTQRIGL